MTYLLSRDPLKLNLKSLVKDVMKKRYTLTIVLLSLALLNLSSVNSRRAVLPPVKVEVKPSVTAVCDTIDTIDRQLETYRNRASIYLGMPRFKAWPVTADLLTQCAKEAWKKYNVLVPLELALVQCLIETGMGLGGRNPKTNPFNIGEWDGGTYGRFSNIKDGIQAYYNLIASRYLVNGRGVEDLFKSFRDKGGYLYATEGYGQFIKPHYYSIKKWIDENL